MSGLGLLVTGLIIGFFIGRKSVKKNVVEKKQKPKRRGYSYNERQYRKVMYESDAERIRELNLLSSKESVFLRLLKQEFLNKEVVVKKKRFFIIDEDKFPIAIFEYRDGSNAIRTMVIEDGLPVFMYKGLLSSEKIHEDAKLIAEEYKRK